MGQKHSKPRGGQGGRTYTSGADVDTIEANQSSSSHGDSSDSFTAPQDLLVSLVNVDHVALFATQEGEDVEVRDFSVYAQPGRLGDIPVRIRSEVKQGGYTKGYLV